MDTAIITVRSSSSRLPRKCYLPFGNITVLEHIIKRVEHYNLKPIVCTSSNTSDHRIVKIAKNLKVDYFCGSSINKLTILKIFCELHLDCNNSGIISLFAAIFKIFAYLILTNILTIK